MECPARERGGYAVSMLDLSTRKFLVVEEKGRGPRCRIPDFRPPGDGKFAVAAPQTSFQKSLDR